MAFFSEGNNIIWSYVICGGFILVSVAPLLAVASKLTDLKVNVVK
jgi:hypothetical protein